MKDTGYGKLAVKQARSLLIEMELIVPVQQHRSNRGRYGKKVFRVIEPWYEKHPTAPRYGFNTSPRYGFDTLTAVWNPYPEGVPVEGIPIEGEESAAVFCEADLEGGVLPLQTTPKEKTPSETQRAEAWDAIGINGHGPRRYREGWPRAYQEYQESTPSAKLSDVMEQFILYCESQQIKIPHGFYVAKRAIEARETRQASVPVAGGSEGKGKFDGIPVY
jgi:hypothetical protein